MIGDEARLVPAARVLLVCTANVARSPYAEYKLRSELRERSITGVDIDSAGTYAHRGSPAAGPIISALTRHGVDISGFRSKPLNGSLLRTADLILTAEASQRGDVVRLDPLALPRVFTLRQFARLVPLALDGEPGILRDVPGLAHACADARGSTGPAADDDIADPWHRSWLTYRKAIGRIDHAIAVTVQVGS